MANLLTLVTLDDNGYICCRRRVAGSGGDLGPFYYYTQVNEHAPSGHVTCHLVCNNFSLWKCEAV